MKLSDIKHCAKEAHLHVNHDTWKALERGQASVHVPGDKKTAQYAIIHWAEGKAGSDGFGTVVIARKSKHNYRLTSSEEDLSGSSKKKLLAFGKACIRAVRKHHVKG